VGLAGLMGAGRSEVAAAVFGLAPAVAGEIRVDGRAVRVRSPAEAMRLESAW
jgi:ABC-type sugar transport system ATPase subunit